MFPIDDGGKEVEVTDSRNKWTVDLCTKHYDQLTMKITLGIIPRKPKEGGGDDK